MDACLVTDDNMEKSPSAGARGTNQSWWNRSQQTENAPGGQRVLALASSRAGFTASGLAEKARTKSGESDSAYGTRRAAHDIKKLRAKGTEDRGLATLRSSTGGCTSPDCSGGFAREHVIRPLLAASTRPLTDSKLVNPMRIDQHYENLRLGMQQLFSELEVAA
jgi:hypothetical protein